jgi:hypothetical protein
VTAGAGCGPVGTGIIAPILHVDEEVAVKEECVTVSSAEGVATISHVDKDGAVGAEEPRESPVDQKLALKIKPARSPNKASPTRGKAKADHLLARRVCRRRYTDTLGVATAGREMKGATTSC